MSYKRNTIASVHFVPVNKNTGDVMTSGSASAFYSGAGGGSSATAVATTNSPTHKGNGVWEIIMTATEMNFDTVSIRPVITDMVPQIISISTERKFVSDLNDFNYTQTGVNLRFVNGITVSEPNDLKADVSGLSTFDPDIHIVSTGTSVVRADIRQVTGNAVSSVDDFKADVDSITNAIAGMTIDANITHVQSTEVDGIEDFHGSTEGLSTFDHTNPNHTVRLGDLAITSDVLDTSALVAIANQIMTYNIDGNGSPVPYVNFKTVQEMLLAFMSGRVDVLDNGPTRTFTFYTRGSTAISFRVTASEQDSFEGQRATEGTIGN